MIPFSHPQKFLSAFRLIVKTIRLQLLTTKESSVSMPSGHFWAPLNHRHWWMFWRFSGTTAKGVRLVPSSNVLCSRLLSAHPPTIQSARDHAPTSSHCSSWLLDRRTYCVCSRCLRLRLSPRRFWPRGSQPFVEKLCSTLNLCTEMVYHPVRWRSAFWSALSLFRHLSRRILTSVIESFPIPVRPELNQTRPKRHTHNKERRRDLWASTVGSLAATVRWKNQRSDHAHRPRCQRVRLESVWFCAVASESVRREITSTIRSSQPGSSGKQGFVHYIVRWRRGWRGIFANYDDSTGFSHETNAYWINSLLTILPLNYIRIFRIP